MSDGGDRGRDACGRDRVDSYDMQSEASTQLGSHGKEEWEGRLRGDSAGMNGAGAGGVRRSEKESPGEGRGEAAGGSTGRAAIWTLQGGPGKYADGSEGTYGHCEGDAVGMRGGRGGQSEGPRGRGAAEGAEAAELNSKCLCSVCECLCNGCA